MNKHKRSYQNASPSENSAWYESAFAIFCRHARLFKPTDVSGSKVKPVIVWILKRHGTEFDQLNEMEPRGQDVENRFRDPRTWTSKKDSQGHGDGEKRSRQDGSVALGTSESRTITPFPHGLVKLVFIWPY